MMARRMPLLSGSRLGSYEIRSPPGAGGMGELYLARDTKLQRRRAEAAAGGGRLGS
jgi:hypothetical protein